MPVETEEEQIVDSGTETSEATAKVETPAVDRSALESKVKDAFSEMFAEDNSDDSSTDDAGETGEEVVDDDKASETVDDETPADEGEQPQDEETTDAEEAAAKPAEKPKANAPTLPDAYRRSLKAYEWTDEEIDANFEALGPKFIETAAKLHANRNAEVSKWAEAGRAARQQEQGGKEAPAQQQPLQALTPINAAKLKESYGDDALIDSLVSPVNAAIQQINAIMPVIQQTQQRSQQAELETLGRQIEGFFGGKELEAYKELYGDPTKTTLTDGQTAARNKVLETADALMAGASLQGRKLSLGEALTLAHDSASGGFKATAARQTLSKSLKQREKGISLRPTGRKPGVAAGKPGDRNALQNKVKTGLAAVFS